MCRKSLVDVMILLMCYLRYVAVLLCNWMKLYQPYSRLVFKAEHSVFICVRRVGVRSHVSLAGGSARAHSCPCVRIAEGRMLEAGGNRVTVRR